MAKYIYTYGGSQAAFVFSGVAILPVSVPITLEQEAHEKLTSNKFAKHLIDNGELVVEEIANDPATKSTGKVGNTGKANGKGGKSSAAADAEKATQEAHEAALTFVKAELTKLEITFSDDEGLEQLQAKLEQAKE